MIKFIKQFTLPIALVIGIVGYKWLGELNFLTPYMIFTMLFLTFTKINYANLKPSLLHLWLLIIEIGLSIGVFYLLAPFNLMLAQGIMICVLAPTGTATAVITKKLGGDIEFVASYTLYANMAVAFVAPLMFPVMQHNLNIEFWSLFSNILMKIVPILICPFILAAIIKQFPKIHYKIRSYSDLAFYIWAAALIIVIAKIVKYFVEEDHNEIITIMLCIGALVACLAQFFIGKIIGKKYGNTIAAGQSLGQKNTVLAIWLGNVYFNPIVAVGAGAYVIWQNVFNSIQIYLHDRKNNNCKSSQ